MTFQSAAECHSTAYKAGTIVRKVVEPYLNDAFSRGSLAHLDLKLRYVPIVMPADMIDMYPERSFANVPLRVYDCATHIDFVTYVSGNLKQQLTKYFRGTSLVSPHLVSFVAGPDQLVEFEHIIDAGPSILEKK